jgi:hypothetical protein
MGKNLQHFSELSIFFSKFSTTLSVLEHVINITISNFLIAKFCMLSRVSSDRISFCSSKARVPLLWDSSVLSAPAYKSDSNGFIKFKFWPPLNGAKAFEINYFVTISFQFRLQIVKSLCRIKREYQTRTAAL